MPPAPSLSQPWVVAWYVLAVCMVAVSLGWVFLRGGAKAIADHPVPGFLPLTTPRRVKLAAVGGAVSVAVGMGLAMKGGAPLPYWATRTGDGYRTVFVVYDGFWRTVGLGLLFLSVGVAALVVAITWIRRLRIPRWWNSRQAGKPSFLLVWSVIWLLGTAIGFSLNFAKSYALLRTYSDGTAQVVEGTVHVLREQPAEGHAPGDLVEVNGTELEVDRFVVTPAYTRTIAYGGALREGARVRVWHHEGKVLRVDIPPEGRPGPDTAGSP